MIGVEVLTAPEGAYGFLAGKELKRNGSGNLAAAVDSNHGAPYDTLDDVLADPPLLRVHLDGTSPAIERIVEAQLCLCPGGRCSWGVPFAADIQYRVVGTSLLGPRETALCYECLGDKQHSQICQ